MKQLIIIILGLMFFTGCTSVDVSKLDQQKVDEAIILCEGKKDFGKCVERNYNSIEEFYINETTISTPKKKPKTKEEKRKELKLKGEVSCFDKKNAAKKGQCFTREEEIILYDPSMIQFQQTNLRHGENYGLFDLRAWDVECARIEEIEIITNMPKLDLSFVNEKGTGKRKTFKNIEGSVILKTNFKYCSSDKTLNIYIHNHNHSAYDNSIVQLYARGVEQ